MKGTVKFFNEKKKWGFILGDDGKDYFIHVSNLLNTSKLEKDDQVMFGTKRSENGLVAFDVQIIEANDYGNKHE